MEELELTIEKIKDKWELMVRGQGLTVLVSADTSDYPTRKHVAWMVRQAMDGLLLATKDKEHLVPTEIRKRRDTVFTRAPRGRRR